MPFSLLIIVHIWSLLLQVLLVPFFFFEILVSLNSVIPSFNIAWLKIVVSWYDSDVVGIKLS